MSSWHYLQRYVLPKVAPHLSRFHRRGLARLAFDSEVAPDPLRLRDQVLRETGWELVRAQGEVPAPEFFRLLSEKRFPLVYELREVHSLFASANPDFWHEVFGHVPVLWDREIGEIYQVLGQRACAALASGDQKEFKRVCNFYWYVCEYGIVLEEGQMKLLGAGIVASPLGPYKLKNPEVKIKELDVGQMESEEMNPYQFQSRLYYARSTDQLLGAVYG